MIGMDSCETSQGRHCSPVLSLQSQRQAAQKVHVVRVCCFARCSTKHRRTSNPAVWYWRGNYLHATAGGLLLVLIAWPEGDLLDNIIHGWKACCTAELQYAAARLLKECAGRYCCCRSWCHCSLVASLPSQSRGHPFPSLYPTELAAAAARLQLA